MHPLYCCISLRNEASHLQHAPPMPRPPVWLIVNETFHHCKWTVVCVCVCDFMPFNDVSSFVLKRLSCQLNLTNENAAIFELKFTNIGLYPKINTHTPVFSYPSFVWASLCRQCRRDFPWFSLQSDKLSDCVNHCGIVIYSDRYYPAMKTPPTFLN